MNQAELIKQKDEEYELWLKRQKQDGKLERLKKGHVEVTHKLLWQAKSKVISKSAYILMTILLHLENMYVEGKNQKKKRGKAFFHSNADMCSYNLMNEKTLQKAREELVENGFIRAVAAKDGKSAYSYTILDFEGYVGE